MSFSNVKQVQQIKIPNIDKIVHFTMYATFAFLWMWALVKKTPKSFSKYAKLIFLIGAIFGIIIEFLQENLTQTRSGEFLDVVCNCAGIFSGLIISKLILK